MNLIEYIKTHADRGECNCGKCLDRGEKPDPTGHVVDLCFFKVAAINAPDKDEFERLAREHKGEFCDVDPFDGHEHNYMELGGWIGDQGLALLFMGLGSLLGSFSLFTPKMLGLDDAQAIQLAGSGLLTVTAKPAPVEA